MTKRTLSTQTIAGIVSYIKENDLGVGHHLTAQALADALRVSRAPVTAALRDLAKTGSVRLEPNKGYFLARDAGDIKLPGEIRPGEPEGEDPFYSRLVEACLSGGLSQRVSETELMRRFDVPRTRVARVLARIETEGWAARRPGHGWEFLPRIVSRANYEEAYRFRAAVESQALMLPTFRIDPDAFALARAEQHEILDGGFERLPRARLFELNTRFHEMLIGCARNDFFSDALARVNRLRRLLDHRITVDRAQLPLQSKEHLLLLEIIETGERERASDFLRTHILGASAMKTPNIAE